MLLTIFTPTYNRAQFLEPLYKSILSQPQRENFEWLIIDDGSADNTKEIVENFICENLINIRYVYQENQGKMQAHNTALKEARGRWFFCMDSDDVMAEDSLGWFYENQDKYFSEGKLAGILSYKKVLNSPYGEVNYMPVADGTRMSLTKLRKKAGFKGEPIVFFKIDVLRLYPFPKVEGEKFIPETIVFDQICRKYEYVVFDKYFQIGVYQETGYTFNIFKLQLKNPKGTALSCNQTAKFEKSLITKCKFYAIYCAYALLANNKKIIKNSNNPFLCFFVYPFGKRYYKKTLLPKLENIQSEAKKANEGENKV